jgi:hypothetical protein
MHDFFRLKTWVLSLGMIIIALVFSAVLVYRDFLLKEFGESVFIAQAGASDNVTGFAWSENIGWISFNCTSEGDCTNDYGVDIEKDIIGTRGNFSGYAWSSNVGWIALERAKVCNDDNSIYCKVDQDCTDAGATGPCNTVDPDFLPDNYAFNSVCANCTEAHNCTACYNWGDQNVYGWAKILSLGDDGWIKFRDVSWAEGVTIDPVGSEFSGWAWNEDGNGTGIGWISFNSENCDTDDDGLSDGGGECPSAGTPIPDYEVKGDISAPPTVDNLSSPNWSEASVGGNVCSTHQALIARLKWRYNDDVALDGKAYQVVVDTTNLGDPSVGGDFDTGKCLKSDGVHDDCIIDFAGNNAFCLEDGGYCWYTVSTSRFGAFDYDTDYYWWVRTWDNDDVASDWKQYDTDPDTDNDNGVILTFKTYKHEFPNPSFTWHIPDPSEEEQVLFIGSAKYYPGDFTTVTDCTDNPPCSWQWTAIPPAVHIYSPNASSTIMEFDKGVQQATLEVGDGDYLCSTSTTFDVRLELPTWKETK